MQSDAVTALKKASKGLLYTSETDAPFEVFTWKNGTGALSTAKLLTLAEQDPASPVEVTTVDEFFAPLIAEKDWHGREEKAIVQKFKALRRAVDANLKDPNVYRVGTIEIAIYLVGQAHDGDWAGLKTTSVET
jgi:Nuclease A inhibitor-like protein